MPKSAIRLTEDEGTFLALLVRAQPATAYQLSKVYEQSPVSNFGTSKGKIYPLMKRLEERGLLRKRQVRGDSRGTELLECTKKGTQAVRDWVMEIRPAHLLLDDPLRTKTQSFDLLSKEEKLEWIANARVGLHGKLQELEAYAKAVDVPFKEAVHDNAVSSIRCRLDWLDRLLASIIK